MGHHLQARRLLLTIIAIAAIILNEFALPLFIGESGFSKFTFYVLRLFDLGLVYLFAVILFRVSYTHQALILFNTLILFGILNVISAIVLKKELSDPLMRNVIEPAVMLNDKPQLMRKIYEGRSNKEILALIDTPELFIHPIMNFMEKPIASQFYNVGQENMRYHSLIENQADTGKVRDQINGGIWLFSGSTGFGHGVSDDQTIPYYLNDELRKSGVSIKTINFAVQGFIQDMEIKKLLHLLKKGYRPSSVVFLDGLNDINWFPGNVFMPRYEKPFLHEFYAVYFTNSSLTRQWKSAVSNLPAIQLLHRLRSNSAEKDMLLGKYFQGDKIDRWNIYDPKGPFVRNPANGYAMNEAITAYVDTLEGSSAASQSLVRELVDYWDNNLHFLSKISQSFGFEFKIFLQPNGFTTSGNPFWKADIRKTFRHKYNIQAMAGLGDWCDKSAECMDISQIGRSCDMCWVDGTHYSPSFNAVIGREIAEKLGSGAVSIE